MTKIIAQNWLSKISDKGKVKVLGKKRLLGLKDEEIWELKNDETLDGELKIDGFPNLESIDFGEDTDGNKGFLTKVTITNCPNLKTLDLFNNEIYELDVSNLTKLDRLIVSNNNLGKINVTGCESLRSIITFNKKNVGDKGTEEKWEGLESLKSLVIINSNFSFFPIKELKNWKTVIDPVKGLNDILKANDGTIDEVKLQEYRDAKSRPTQSVVVAANQKIQDYETKLKIALGLSSTASLPPDWEKRIVSKTKYNALETYSSKQESVINNFKKQFRTGMIGAELQEEIRLLPTFKPS